VGLGVWVTRHRRGLVVEERAQWRVVLYGGPAGGSQQWWAERDDGPDPEVAFADARTRCCSLEPPFQRVPGGQAQVLHWQGAHDCPATAAAAAEGGAEGGAEQGSHTPLQGAPPPPPLPLAPLPRRWVASGVLLPLHGCVTGGAHGGGRGGGEGEGGSECSSDLWDGESLQSLQVTLGSNMPCGGHTDWGDPKAWAAEEEGEEEEEEEEEEGISPPCAADWRPLLETGPSGLQQHGVGGSSLQRGVGGSSLQRGVGAPAGSGLPLTPGSLVPAPTCHPSMAHQSGVNKGLDLGLVSSRGNGRDNVQGDDDGAQLRMAAPAARAPRCGHAFAKVLLGLGSTQSPPNREGLTMATTTTTTTTASGPRMTLLAACSPPLGARDSCASSTSTNSGGSTSSPSLGDSILPAPRVVVSRKVVNGERLGTAVGPNKQGVAVRAPLSDPLGTASAGYHILLAGVTSAKTPPLAAHVPRVRRKGPAQGCSGVGGEPSVVTGPGWSRRPAAAGTPSQRLASPPPAFGVPSAARRW
jgi:hypothetical protein